MCSRLCNRRLGTGGSLQKYRIKPGYCIEKCGFPVSFGAFYALKRYNNKLWQI